MENTALNGTTITKDQGWKTKKGYSIVAVSLALVLGLSFSAGRHSAAMRIPNGMTSSSSSSLSLVGSGTAAASFSSGPGTVVGPGEPCETVKDCPQFITQEGWATYTCENGRCEFSRIG